MAAATEFLATLITPNALEEMLDQLQTQQGNTDLEADLAATGQCITQLQEQRKRLALTLAAGHMDVTVYRQADDELLARLETTRARHAELETALATIPNWDERRTLLRDIIATFPDLLAEADPIVICTRLQNIGFRVYCEEGAVVFCGFEA